MEAPNGAWDYSSRQLRVGYVPHFSLSLSDGGTSQQSIQQKDGLNTMRVKLRGNSGIQTNMMTDLQFTMTVSFTQISYQKNDSSCDAPKWVWEHDAPISKSYV